MWPFDRLKTVAKPPEPSLEHRLDAIERALAAHSADTSLLRREWADTLDKLQTWFGREAARKRKQLHTALENVQETAEVDPQAPNGHGVVDKAALRRIAAQRLTGRRIG